MHEWSPEKITERAKEMRTAAQELKDKADIYMKHAILLEEIAKDWTARRASEETAKLLAPYKGSADAALERRKPHWIRWGMYLKCSQCGHLSEDQSDECPECHARMEGMK